LTLVDLDPDIIYANSKKLTTEIKTCSYVNSLVTGHLDVYSYCKSI